MFDSKVVRRRRAVLAIFVALSLIMLTAYFGESSGGVFHTLQRGAQSAFAPVETGAGRALKPVRDLFGWVGDTFHAKGQNKQLKAEVQDLREQLGASATAERDAQQLRGLVKLNGDSGYPADTRPVAARVIARSPTVWYSTVKIDRGSSDGLKKNQPVIAAGGLAGKISSVTGGTADVTLITDGTSAVSAQVMPNGATGIVKPEVGKPDDLLLDFVQKKRRVTQGSVVVTSGFKSASVESLFPRGVPIGKVTKVDLDEVELYQRVHIRPFADLRRVDFVQVLTSRGRQPSQQADVATP
jgi:rod shape-determining protein MreC